MNLALSTPQTHVLLLGSMRFMYRQFYSNASITTSLICDREKPEDNKNNLYTLYSEDISQWHMLAREINALKPITHIACFDDLTQDIAADIAASFDLAFHNLTTVRAVQNKFTMRSILRAAGLDDTPSSLVSSIEDVLNFMRNSAGKAVIKPVDGQGSNGIAIVESSEDVIHAFEDCLKRSKDRPLLIESWIDGIEYSVETFSEDGSHRIVCITKKYTDQVNTVEYCHQVPADLTESVEKEIGAFVVSVLNALAILNGPTHTEILLTRAGPRLIETHLRLGGGFIPELVQAALGIDLYKLTTAQVIGDSVISALDDQLASLNQQRYASVYFRYALLGTQINSEIGTIYDYTGLDYARTAENVISAGVLKKHGNTIYPARSTSDRLAYVQTLADSAVEAFESARQAASLIGILVLLAPNHEV